MIIIADVLYVGMFVSAEEVYQSLLKEESDEIFIDYRETSEKVKQTNKQTNKLIYIYI